MISVLALAGIAFHAARPWTAQVAFQLKPKWELIEFVCEDTYLNFSDYQKKIDAGPGK
jgi:hypothetical protein